MSTLPSLSELSAFYRRQLLDDVVPFWMRHSLDREHGGYLTCLARDGTVYNTDKAIWLQGREVWMFSKLYNTVEQRPEWLEAARLGVAFLLAHGFDADGRMFFSVTQDGRPLRRRRYLFSETFAIIALAEYARATGDAAYARRAEEVYAMTLRYYRTPGLLPPKVIPETRQTKGLSMPMILLATTQELRGATPTPLQQDVADDSLRQITQDFLKREEHALHETVGPRGERLDSPEGRCVNPGHSIEVAWFMLHEAVARNDADIARTALDILDWSLEWGWDKQYGGLFSFVDIEGKPPEQLEWDMKLWWPHTETLYATLLAYHLTGEERYLAWHERLRDYAFAHFSDPEYGEWYGYLHRDGTVSNTAKGGMWKGAFHTPRGLWLCWRLLEQMQQAPGVHPFRA